MRLKSTFYIKEHLRGLRLEMCPFAPFLDVSPAAGAEPPPFHQVLRLAKALHELDLHAATEVV